jgi:two-component system OmpR family response regulator
VRIDGISRQSGCGQIVINRGAALRPRAAALHFMSIRKGPMKKVIAIVEDEPAIRDNYAAAFTRHGYAVRTYGTRKEAIEAFRGRLPDLAVIDVGLRDEPEGGFELCRELRSLSPELPIIFLTARDSELDAVSGLRLGADDYLTKDLSLSHLMARVTALFRRIDALTQPSNRDQIVTRGALLIDTARLHAAWQEKPLGLTLTEFWIVHALAKNPGHVKNRQQLMDADQRRLSLSVETNRPGAWRRIASL